MSREITCLTLLIGLGVASLAFAAAETRGTLASSEQPRLWTDAGGKYHVTGTLIEVRGDKLVLRKTDGEYVMPAVALLSTDDRAYVAAFLRTAAAANEPALRTAQPISASAMSAAPATTAPAEPSAGQPSLLQQVLPVAIQGLGNFSMGLGEAEGPEPVRLMYMVVSRKFLDAVIPPDLHEVRPTSDVVGGTTFTGTVTTSGRSGLEFVPNPSQATIALRFTGISVSDTVGGDQVQIQTRTTTSIDATKHVLLDATGVHARPTQTEAHSVTETLGLSTDLPGLRGRIATGIAGRRVESTRTQVEADSAERAERATNRAIDQQVDAPLTVWNDLCQKFFAAGRPGNFELAARTNSTANELRLLVYRRPSRGTQPEPMPEPIAGRPAVAIWIHSSLVKRVITDAHLQQALQPLLARLQTQVSLASQSDAAAPNFQIHWTDGGKWLNVSFDRPASRRPAAGNRVATAQQ